MTEGNGHVIDPAGAARRALQAAVAEHGPQALSDADIVEGICRDSLTDLPGEAALIRSASRTDVPALLRELIPRLGNYGAIQSVAATLSEAHSLDTAACLWVVREFARALGFIAPGGTQPSPSASTGSGGFTDRDDAVPPGPAAPGAAAPGPAAPGPAAPGAAAPGAAAPGAAAPGAAAPGAAAPGPPPPGRPASRSRRPGRNVLGIAAAIVLVAVYLGVAAVAHLSPFPAKAVASTSSAGGGQGNGANPTPDASADASPDAAPDSAPNPPSQYDTLLSMIPGNVRGENNCTNVGTSVGATAQAQCSKVQGLAAKTIFYYLFSDQGALSGGFNTFLKNEKFKKGSASCTASNNAFVDFVVQCEDNFTSTAPEMTGSIAEYTNTDNDPIIVSSDNQQLVMAVMIGTNDGDLLAYWKQLQWIEQ